MKRIATAVAVLVATVVLGSGTPADAQQEPVFGPDPSTTVSVRTTDGPPIGGTGVFWGDAHGADDDNPEVLGACDKQVDGLRPYAIVSWEDSNGWHVREVENAFGGGGNGCHQRVLPNIADGTTVYIDACLKNGANGPTRFCGSGTAVA